MAGPERQEEEKEMKFSENINDLITEHERLVKRLRECDEDELHDELDRQEKELKNLRRFLAQKGK